MDKETFLSKITEIGTLEDDVARRTILAELSSEATNLFDTNNVLSTQNKQFETDNESLRQANMKLFLQVGESKSVGEVVQNTTGNQVIEEQPKRKFEDLFNEKGMIK